MLPVRLDLPGQRGLKELALLVRLDQQVRLGLKELVLLDLPDLKELLDRLDLKELLVRLDLKGQLDLPALLDRPVQLV